MRLFVLDTCLAACQCAVFADGAALASRSEAMRRGHQERIGPMAREAMEEAELAFSELDLIAVTVGPGSFTGLRVGLAFAKGLALATGRPLAGLGTLAALAEGVEGRRMAVIEAGRGGLWLQAFDGPRALGEPAQVAAQDFDLASGGTLIGPTAAALAAPGQAAIERPWPDVDSIARLAAAAPDAPTRPLYLRAPDARPKRA